ncbi:MAG: hypothetical protein PHY73_04995 [Candidatus Omnitrophica bacterium]|nr:hypothetical protein [Candidatus Omnitrophota bacterium]
MNVKNKKGIALITSYFIIFALTIMSTAFLAQSVSEKRTAEHYAKSTQAFWIAEGGVEQTLWELNSNGCSNCQACGLNQCLAGTIPGVGDYDVVIDLTNNTLSSIGSVPSRTSEMLGSKTIEISLSGGSNPIFTHAAYANNEIQIQNNVIVDSYDSSIGSYNVSGNIAANGDIGTSGTSTDIIDINNNAYIAGDVSTGPEGTVDIGNNATISGTISDENDRILESVVIPSVLTELTSQGDKTVGNNGSWILTSGTYRYDSITLKNNVDMTVSGDVTIYVSGDFNVKNNADITVTPGSSLTYYTDGTFQINNNSTVNNMTQIPANFIVYSTFSGDDGILFNNNGELYGAVYAPDTDVELRNNAVTYGALVGDTVTLKNNAGVHYDEDLASISSGSSSGYTIATWQEL